MRSMYVSGGSVTCESAEIHGPSVAVIPRVSRFASGAVWTNSVRGYRGAERRRREEAVVGRDDDQERRPDSDAVEEVVARLCAHNTKIAVAESCTGGLIATSI